MVVTEDTVNAVFATKDKATVEALFKVVGLQAVKPVIEDFDPAQAARDLADLVSEPA